MIRTSRLTLVPATVDIVDAELSSRDRLASALTCHVPENWPPEYYDPPVVEFVAKRLRDHPEEAGWWLHYFILEDENSERVLVGCGGYKGPPAEGAVEIGYSILEQFRRRGYASEATNGMCDAAFRQREDVARIYAETLPELTPSIGVLERCRFRLIGEGSEPGVIRYERIRGA